MKSNEPFLRHILDEVNFLLKKTKGYSFRRFERDETLKRAAARSFEIIGEASKKGSSDFKRKHKEIDWKGMAGMRDRLIHGYFEVNWNIVWDVIKEKLPLLKKSIEKALRDLT